VSDIEFTGERFVPGVPGEIAHEHWHRYAFARRFVAGRRTLDVACGAGRNALFLATNGYDVTAVDISVVGLDRGRRVATERGLSVDWLYADLDDPERALPAGLLVLAPKADNDVSFAIVGNVVVASKGGVVIDVMTGVFK